jgi:hypothetical protein
MVSTRCRICSVQARWKGYAGVGDARDGRRIGLIFAFRVTSWLQVLQKAKSKKQKAQP